MGWGDRTVDEMAHARVNITYMDDEDFEAGVAARAHGWRATPSNRSSPRSTSVPNDPAGLDIEADGSYCQCRLVAETGGERHEAVHVCEVADETQ